MSRLIFMRASNFPPILDVKLISEIDKLPNMKIAIFLQILQYPLPCCRGYIYVTKYKELKCAKIRSRQCVLCRTLRSILDQKKSVHFLGRGVPSLHVVN